MKEEIRLKRSRDTWRTKAVIRSESLRESRKKDRRQQQKISELKAEIAELKHEAESEIKKKF
jgi:hypothetical protein